MRFLRQKLFVFHKSKSKSFNIESERTKQHHMVTNNAIPL